MFRFLDKRFSMRSRLTFDIHVFAHEKIGLTRGATTDVAQVKRRLRDAIAELEALRVIKPMPGDLRFTKLKAGRWDIHFEKYDETEQAQANLPIEIESDLSPLEARLAAHGMTPSQAGGLVSEYETERIERQLDALEFLIARAHGGWLFTQGKSGTS